VSNTNTSQSTEEGNGFGQALLDFVVELSSRDVVPQVLSISLGSLSAYSCDLLCSEGVKIGNFSLSDCNDYLQAQRQVCMYLTQDQVERIHDAFKILGTRGTTVFGSSGDGGSHFSFGPFDSDPIGAALNQVSCAFQMPVFPTTSPYVISVGGEDWVDPTQPYAWSGSGGGFSWQFQRPSFQDSVVTDYLKANNGTAGFSPASSFNAHGRAYPDISAYAEDGTSQSSPMIAGIFSMINDHRLNSHLPPLGFLGPRLYQLASQFPSKAFQDIVTGNSQTSCDNGFPATTGWDPVTGFGRPIWSGMLELFGSDYLIPAAAARHH
jgi:subtilase family serine protease